jgi:hypothetical protein
MKKMHAAGALVAALGLAAGALAQVKSQPIGKGQTMDAAKQQRPRLVRTAPERPDVMTGQVWPQGFEPEPGRDLRAVATVYDNFNTSYVYAYSANDITGVGTVLNGGLEGVAFPPAIFLPGSSVYSIQFCVHRIEPGTPSTFKVLVKIWDTVNANATIGTPAHSNQLPTGGPLNLFYTAAGGAPFSVTGRYTVLPEFILPSGIVPVDTNVGIEIRLVSATVTDAASADIPANTHPGMAVDCMSLQNSQPVFPPNPPTVGSVYPADGIGHYWVDIDDATGVPPTVHDGQYFAGQITGVNATPPDPVNSEGEDLWDDDGPTWANILLRVKGDVVIPAPGNDNCGSATVITMPGPAPASTTLTGQTSIGSTAEAVTPPACGVGNPTNQAGVWYSFTGRGRVTTATTCGTGGYSSVLRVYSGTCAAPVCVNGQDDSGTVGCPANLDAATVTWCAANGVTYLIYVRGDDGVAGGNFDLTVTEGSTACPPAPCNLNASGAQDLTPLNPTCGVPTSPMGTCAAAIIATDCTTYFDSLAAGDPGSGRVRGVDSFIYEVPSGATAFNINVTSEFNGIVFVLLAANPADPCQAFLVGSPGQFNTVACVPRTFTVAGTAGSKYLVQIAPGSWDDTTCGATGTKYRMEFRSDVCAPAGPDCFTRGAPGAVGACPPNLTYARPTHPTQGHFQMGGADGTTDTGQCKVDWNGDGCRTPADVATYVTSWFYSANNPGNTDGDYNCDGSVVPADLASFVAEWFDSITNPATYGC